MVTAKKQTLKEKGAAAMAKIGIDPKKVKSDSAEMKKQAALLKSLDDIGKKYEAGKAATAKKTAAQSKSAATAKATTEKINGEFKATQAARKAKAADVPVAPVKAPKKAATKLGIDLEEDAQAPTASNESLLQITQMCGYVKDIDLKIEDLTAKLNQLNGHREKLVEVDIPEAMKIAGLLTFTLTDGSVVTVTTDNYASYTKDNEAAVFDWLRKNGHAGMIKNVVAIQFGKDQDAKAAELVKILTTKKFQDWSQKESVHAGTFKAFVREQLAEGNKLPKQIAIFPKTVAIIKESKNGNQGKSSSTGKASSKASSKDNDRF